MQNTVANIQSDAVQWFYKNAYTDYKPPTNDFVHALHKVFICNFVLKNLPNENIDRCCLGCIYGTC